MMIQRRLSFSVSWPAVRWDGVCAWRTAPHRRGPQPAVRPVKWVLATVCRKPYLQDTHCGRPAWESAPVSAFKMHKVFQKRPASSVLHCISWNDLSELEATWGHLTSVSFQASFSPLKQHLIKYFQGQEAHYPWSSFVRWFSWFYRLLLASL